MSSLRKGVLVAASLGTISLGTAALSAWLPSAAGAAGGKPIVTLGKGAELYARGAAVNVGVHITCTPPTVPTGMTLSQNVSVQLSQVVAGNVVQQGYGSSSEFTCDGSPHTSSVYVTPGAGGLGVEAHPFVDGSAFASASLSICTYPAGFPTPIPFASPAPSPIPSPIPGLPGLPSCQTASNVAVVNVMGNFEG